MGGNPSEANQTATCAPRAEGESAPPRVLHQIRKIRCQQDISLRTVARRLHTSVGDAGAQEEPSADLQLSDLYLWQQVLNVPASELLVEIEDGLSPPINVRARLLRMMKTILTILDRPQPQRTVNLLQNLRGDILAIMPELEDVGPWYGSSNRHRVPNLGAAALRRLDVDEEVLLDY